MIDLKRNRNSLIYAVLLAFVAGGIGIYLSSDVPRKAEEVNNGGGFKDFAVGSMAAFLVKADRPVVPDLVFKDSAGSEVKLSKWQGRVVLLNLWATWCAPCLQEARHLARLRSAYPAERLSIVGVNLDRQAEATAIARFLREGRVNYAQLRGDLSAYSAFNQGPTILLPRLFVFGADGRPAAAFGRYFGGRTLRAIDLAVEAVLA